MKPQPFDLFGEIPVTQDDVQQWCDVMLHTSPMPWRRDYYIRAWNVPEKVRQAKVSGLWFDSILGS